MYHLNSAVFQDLSKKLTNDDLKVNVQCTFSK